MSTTKKKRAPAAYRLPKGRALMLRTCGADMRAHGGFVWPMSGRVTCPDWSPVAECGHGLHGLLWGAGDASQLSTAPDARWLVVEIVAADAVEIGGKIKVPAGRVVHVGDRASAVAFVQAHAPAGIVCVYGTATAGDRGTATAGDGGTATAGVYGTATAGVYGTATAGYGGTATAGDGGTIAVRWWDGDASRYRIAAADVGEGGIEAGVRYRVAVEGGKGRLVPA